MPRSKLDLAVSMIILLLALFTACKRPETQRFPLTVVSWKPLGAKPTDKLPARVADIITLANGPACKKVFVPDAKICRLGIVGDESDACRVVEIKMPMAGDPNNSNLIDRQIRAALSTFTIGAHLSSPEQSGSTFEAELQEFLASQPPKTQVIHLRSDGFHSNDSGKPVLLSTTGELALSLQKRFCEGINPVVIVVGGPEERLRVPVPTSDITATDTGAAGPELSADDTGTVIEVEEAPPSEDITTLAEPAPPTHREPESTETVAKNVRCRTEAVQVAGNLRAPKNMCPPGYTGPDENCECHPIKQD